LLKAKGDEKSSLFYLSEDGAGDDGAAGVEPEAVEEEPADESDEDLELEAVFDVFV